MLNYNGWDLTIECITSIRANCNYPYRIYIVDNCSTVEMTENFKSFISDSTDCELIFNKKNLGYSCGNNVGIKRAICDYNGLIN